VDFIATARAAKLDLEDAEPRSGLQPRDAEVGLETVLSRQPC
jgi:hypothetical protein